MKRSDMVKELSKVIDGIANYGTNSYRLADMILMAAEKRGMVFYRVYDCGCCKNLDWDEEDEEDEENNKKEI